MIKETGSADCYAGNYFEAFFDFNTIWNPCSVSQSRDFGSYKTEQTERCCLSNQLIIPCEIALDFSACCRCYLLYCATMLEGVKFYLYKANLQLKSFHNILCKTN